MFIPFIATRYLFSRKRLNTINLITRVSMAGVGIGTMALICVLSVMNGFERVISDSFSIFDPELRITPASGTHFYVTDSVVALAKQQMPDAVWSNIIDIDGMIASDESQQPVKVRGVDGKFRHATGIDSMMWSGTFDPYYEPHSGIRAAMGVGLATRMHCNVDATRPLLLYAPKSRKVNMARPDANFTKTEFTCNGLFCVQQTVYDDNYIILPIDAVREAYQLDDNYVTAIELKLHPNRRASDKEIRTAKKMLQSTLADGFVVADRYEQQAEFYKISRIEKWTTFMILCFIILVATFNIIGSLSMIIIEKTPDINLLYALGATRKNIVDIFTLEGVLIAATGCSIGSITGIALVLIQQHFGIISLGTTGYITQAYPVELMWTDVLLVVAAVIAMGWATSAYAARAVKSE